MPSHSQPTLFTCQNRSFGQASVEIGSLVQNGRALEWRSSPKFPKLSDVTSRVSCVSCVPNSPIIISFLRIPSASSCFAAHGTKAAQAELPESWKGKAHTLQACSIIDAFAGDRLVLWIQVLLMRPMGLNTTLGTTHPNAMDLSTILRAASQPWYIPGWCSVIVSHNSGWCPRYWHEWQ